MGFFGFGNNRDTREKSRRGYRWDSPPDNKSQHRKSAQTPKDNKSFSRTPRPDHRQSTGRTTGSSNRNDHNKSSNRSQSQRRGMGGKKLY